MILKICYRKSWYIYDNISKVRVGLRNDSDTVKFDYNAKKFWWNDHRDGEGESGEFLPDAILTERYDSDPINGKKLFPLNWIQFRDRDGDEKIIVFDKAYLMNDQGKNIERLFA